MGPGTGLQVDNAGNLLSNIAAVAACKLTKGGTVAEVAANRAAGYVLAPRGGGRFPLLSRGMRI
jgi:hypothetical protein